MRWVGGGARMGGDLPENSPHGPMLLSILHYIPPPWGLTLIGARVHREHREYSTSKNTNLFTQISFQLLCEGVTPVLLHTDITGDLNHLSMLKPVQGGHVWAYTPAPKSRKRPRPAPLGPPSLKYGRRQRLLHGLQSGNRRGIR